MSACRRTISTFRRPIAAVMLRRAFHATAQSADNVASTVVAAAQHIGASGRVYRFEKLIQKRELLGSVWVAEAEGKRYILKDLPKAYFNGFSKHILPRLKADSHPNIRLPCDTISNQRTIVYDYLTHDFLNLTRQGLTPQAKKQVLKGVLRGIAELHDKDIVHLDIKPDNVLVNCSDDTSALIIDKIQLTDFENALPIFPGEENAVFKGAVLGNEIWRSPEGHIASKIGKPTDMFAFGIVCIYGMLGRIVFDKDDDYKYQETQGNCGDLVLLQRQVCYFGDAQGIESMKEFVKDNELLCKVLDASWEDRDSHYVPYKHFSTWPEVEDDDFKNLVLKMTNLDQSKRPTAREALQHAWFSDVEDTGNDTTSVDADSNGIED